jgi:hypothetical protein
MFVFWLYVIVSALICHGVSGWGNFFAGRVSAVDVADVRPIKKIIRQIRTEHNFREYANNSFLKAVINLAVY